MDKIQIIEQEEPELAQWTEEELDERAYQAWLSQDQDQDDDLEEF